MARHDYIEKPSLSLERRNIEASLHRVVIWDLLGCWGGFVPYFRDRPQVALPGSLVNGENAA